MDILGCGNNLEDLRFRRDLAVRDGDLKLAFACAIAIDKKRDSINEKVVLLGVVGIWGGDLRRTQRPPE